MKKCISMFIAVMMILSSLVVSVSAASEIKQSGAYKYRVVGKYAELYRYMGEENPPLNSDGSYTIPSEIDGYEVRYLGDNLFVYNDVPSEKVIIPDTVTALGSRVFTYEEMIYDPEKAKLDPEYEEDYEYMCKMKQVTIPDSVVYIGNSAFTHTPNLQKIVIPDTVKYVGEEAFFGSGIKNAVLGEGIDKIRRGTFDYCQNLKEVVVPDKALTIGKYAFYACPKLKELHIKPGCILNEYSYGVNHMNVGEKKALLVYDLKTKSKTVNLNYAYNHKVNCALNFEGIQKQLLFTEPGVEFRILVNGKPVTGCETGDKKLATVTDDGLVKFVSKTPKAVSVTAVGADGKLYTVRIATFNKIRLAKKSVTVKKNATVKVALKGKVNSINNKYTNTKIAKFTSKKSESTLTVKGLKAGKTTLKVKVNGVKTLKLSVTVK